MTYYNIIYYTPLLLLPLPLPLPLLLLLLYCTIPHYTTLYYAITISPLDARRPGSRGLHLSEYIHICIYIYIYTYVYSHSILYCSIAYYIISYYIHMVCYVTSPGPREQEYEHTNNSQRNNIAIHNNDN